MDDRDFALALALQNEFDNEISDGNRDVQISQTSSSSSMPQTSSSTRNLVDPEWELLDPNPDIHVLFGQFNKTFFWNTLTMVEVRWSPRMTLCAGICCYEGRGGLCSVRLSQPLLKLRPRKDLVETLLHEMIHAYLFVTDNNKDHDGHGPEFCKHMRRINTQAGTNITIYHSFHDEVDEMRKHWWRCTGRCRNLPPYFGYVKRAMNRAPSANDFWWPQHQATCGGTYEKIKEPENYGKKKKKKTNEEKISTSQKEKLGDQDVTKLDPSQRTLNFDVKKPDSKGNILGGQSNQTQTNSRGIPAHSRLLELFGGNKSQSNTSTSQSTGTAKETSIFNKRKKTQEPNISNFFHGTNGIHKPKKQVKVGSNLAVVCQQVRRTGLGSVNANSVAFQRFKPIGTFFSAKKYKQRIIFSSDDEMSDTEQKNPKLKSLCDTKMPLKSDTVVTISNDESVDETAFNELQVREGNAAKRKSAQLSNSQSSESSLTFISPQKKRPNLQATPKKAGSSSQIKLFQDETSSSEQTKPACDETDGDMDISSFCKSRFNEDSPGSSSDEDDLLISSMMKKKNENSSTSSENHSTFTKIPENSNVHSSNLNTANSSSVLDSLDSIFIGGGLTLPQRVPCPICNESISSANINTHIDICLSLKAIRDSNF